MQREIQEAAYQAQLEIEKGQEVVVGVNAFKVKEDLELESLAADPAIEQNQRARLATLRAERDGTRIHELMAQLETAARGSENLMPLMVTCVEYDMTLGEICGVLRRVWGEYQPPAWL
jgi:methylmalonyl-CoA mutase, N-terminal domain